MVNWVSLGGCCIQMEMITGSPMQGARLAALKGFLKSCGLDYDEGISFTTALLDDDGEIIACGSLDGRTLKCIAVSPLHQGEDLTARILTELRREAFDRGVEQLLLFTKPRNQMMFASFGFYPLVRTADCLLMENSRDGLERFLSGIEKHEGSIGCIVANCNPFTKGHRYLIETAAAQVDHLYLFILSEDKSRFPADVRLMLAREGCMDLKNVSVYPSGPYMVSSATFPTYFIKDKDRVTEIFCELDLRLFGEKIAPALGISRRYVGTEPISAGTRLYNEAMQARLPEYGIEVIELPRMEFGGTAISASRVRTMMENNDSAGLGDLLPESTLRHIQRNPLYYEH